MKTLAKNLGLVVGPEAR